MSTNVSNSSSQLTGNIKSGTGTVNAKIDNGYPYPDYSGKPRIFVTGNGVVVLRTDHEVDALTKTHINWRFPANIANGHHVFDNNNPSSPPPLECAITRIDPVTGESYGETYISDKNFGFVDINFDITEGTLATTFKFKFPTYDNPPKIHEVTGNIDVAGLVPNSTGKI